MLRHPYAALVASVGGTVALALPALGMTLHSANLSTLPQDMSTVTTANRVPEAFPSQGTTALVVVTGSPAQQPAVAAALSRLAVDAQRTGLFADPGPAGTGVSTDRTVTSLALPIPFEERDPKVDKAIRTMRAELAPGELESLGVSYAVGGGAAASLDFADRQTQRMPWVIGFVLVLTLTMMILAFRSVPLALVSTAMNLLSVGVAFGTLRLVFQDGHLESLLDFSSPGFLVDWIPLFVMTIWIPLFVMTILIGLWMDYHVFVLSRVREYAVAGVPAREVVRRGITDTAGVITSAAAVMVSVFSIFSTLSMLEMKMMGVGLATAILIDATVIRLVMLPAALVILGDRTWWPGLRRRRPAPEPARTPEPEPALV